MAWRSPGTLAEGRPLAVKVKDNGAAKVLAASKGKAKIEVGILGPKAHNKHKGSDVVLSDIAGFHEFGTRNIPRRPFVSGWFDSVIGSALPTALKQSAQKLLAGKIDESKYIKLLGNFGVGGIQKFISAGVKPALAKSTIKRKGSSVPLIDTGVLRSSITFRAV